MWYLHRLLLLVALSASQCFSAPSKPCGVHKLKEAIAPPRGWVKHSVPPPDREILLRIALPQPNFHILEQNLYEVSDPFHERYGQHLSKEEVEKLVAPHQESVDAVSEWLATHGIRESDFSRSPAKDWVSIKLPVKLIEDMLNTTFHVWKHTASGDTLTRTLSYSLPEHLHSHIDLIQPTTMFGRMKAEKSTSFFKGSPIPVASDSKTLPQVNDPVSGVSVDASCNTTITVSCLKQLYNAVGFVPSAKGNSFAVTAYLEEFANKQDLQTFFAQQVPDAVGSDFNFISVAGGLNNQTTSAAGVEANLDTQFGFGITHPIPATFYSTAGRPPFIPDADTPTNENEPYTEWLDFVLSHPNPPLTISTSYADDEQTVPESFAQRVCAGFAQLGARGVSLMFSSGDSGVGDGDPNPATQTCFTNDGKNQTKFIPTFPPSCPFVTSVGATTQIAPEVAVMDFFSGGGFSNYFSRPSFQNTAVQRYLDALPKGTYAGLFNPAGRGIPDVSAQGENFLIIFEGQQGLVDGTSCASPTFAAIVSLLNDARLKAGKSPLGFLNPLLYSLGVAGLNDILSGHNPGCGTPGFNVTKGWDPVTGLGTPNFEKLKSIVLST